MPLSTSSSHAISKHMHSGDHFLDKPAAQAAPAMPPASQPPVPAASATVIGEMA